MGKYIKYFNTTEELAEYWNFGNLAEGPDGAEETMVAFVAQNNAVYYYNSDMSEFEVLFEPVDPAIAASSDTVSFNIKTGLFRLDVYHNGEFVIDYRPGEDTSDAFSVDVNESPLTVNEVFIAKWYKDDNGQKGDFITEQEVSVTHEPDPNADPVTLQCVSYFISDGQTPTRLGSAGLTGATKIHYFDPYFEQDTDITSNVYVQNKRVFYQFPEGEFEVKFEWETENQVVGDWFGYSQGTFLDIYTNYPELAEKTNFSLQGPMMQSSIEEVTLGEGMQRVSSSAFMMANNLNLISIEDQNKLPVVEGSFFGIPQTGTLNCNEDAENFEMWEAAIPSGWEINPGQGGDTVGKVTLVFDIDSTDYQDPIVGGDSVQFEFGGTMDLYDPNGNLLSYGSDFRLYTMKNNTYLQIYTPTDGAYSLILRRESADLLLQEWLSQGEFRMFTYEEESFNPGDTHISLMAFSLADCANLEQVYLGTGFTSVDVDTFSGCESLDLIQVEEVNTPSITGGNSFTTLSDHSGTLVVPSGSTYSNWATALGQDWTIDDSL